MTDTGWMTVKTGKHWEVELARTLLESAGIPTRLPEEPERYFGNPFDGSNNWHLPLQVPADRAEEAERLLTTSDARPDAEEHDRP